MSNPFHLPKVHLSSHTIGEALALTVQAVSDVADGKLSEDELKDLGNRFVQIVRDGAAEVAADHGE